MRDHRPLGERQKKLLAGAGLGLFLLLSGLMFVFAGGPLVRFASEPALFRAWVEERGLAAHLIFVGMVVLQVIVAVIPGEPLEIAAGYAFGAIKGTLLCVLGALTGSVLVFLLVRRFGRRAVEVFFSLEKFRSLSFLQNERRRNGLIFLLFFLPGTPKDVLCYFVGLTDMPLRTWVLISAVARIPSIVTSTVGGSALGEQEYLSALLVFLVTGALSIGGLLLYRRICDRRQRRS